MCNLIIYSDTIVWSDDWKSGFWNSLFPVAKRLGFCTKHGWRTCSCETVRTKTWQRVESLRHMVAQVPIRRETIGQPQRTPRLTAKISRFLPKVLRTEGTRVPPGTQSFRQHAGLLIPARALGLKNTSCLQSSCWFAPNLGENRDVLARYSTPPLRIWTDLKIAADSIGGSFATFPKQCGHT